MLCRFCGKEINEENLSKERISHYKKIGYGYCGKECSKEYRRKISSETMKKTNARYHNQIVERMVTKNPMKNADVRKAVSNRLKEIGHHPKIRCGNGMGLTVPQQMLMLALAAENVEVYAEYPIPTRMPRDSGYPTCYKVDIALIDPMLAIEVDGNSHYAIERQKQDQKKEQFLNGLGWKVLRFSNKQVTEHLEDCVQMVMSTISR